MNGMMMPSNPASIKSELTIRSGTFTIGYLRYSNPDEPGPDLSTEASRMKPNSKVLE
jgi:hypothetical protein